MNLLEGTILRFNLNPPVIFELNHPQWYNNQGENLNRVAQKFPTLCKSQIACIGCCHVHFPSASAQGFPQFPAIRNSARNLSQIEWIGHVNESNWGYLVPTQYSPNDLYLEQLSVGIFYNSRICQCLYQSLKHFLDIFFTISNTSR